MSFPSPNYTLTGVAASYRPDNGASASLPGVVTPWSRAVESNGVLFLDNGQQIFLGSDGKLHAALWQYFPPVQSVAGFNLNTVTNANSNLAAATYSYAFVYVVQLPQSDGTVSQTTTPLYENASGANLFSITTNGKQDIQVAGTFAGLTADGYPFVTQVYRESSLVASWYLVTTLTTNNVYTDTNSDQSIEGNQQMTLDNDPPPTGVLVTGTGFALNPIESFQDRMWVLARVQNAATNNLPQTQLWYSRPGLPWSFDAELQVLLSGDEATLPEAGTFGTLPIYGDLPAGLAKVGSVLLAFKSNSTYIVYGTDQSNYQVVPIFNDIGCVAPLSLIKGNSVIFWLSSQGVFSYDGASLQYLSGDIYNALQQYPPTALQQAVGSYADLTYVLSLPTAGVSFAYYIPGDAPGGKKWTMLPYATNAAVYSPVTRNIVPQGGKWNQIAAAEPGTYDVDLWFVGPYATSSIATEILEYDLDGPITVEWTSPLQDGGDPNVQKNFAYLSIHAPVQAVQAEVTLTLDPGFANSPPPFTYTFDLSVGPTTRTVRVPQVSSLGYFAQLSIVAVNATAPNQHGLVTATGATIQIWGVSVGGSVKRSWTVPS